MKTRFSLLIVMVLLLGLLPAVAAAAPPKPPFVSVRDWTLPVVLQEPWPVGELSAWDISWKVPRAGTVELGYVYCKEGLCTSVVEATYRITKDDKYPQDLDLAGKPYYMFTPGDCSLQQFVQILDRTGAVLAEALSVEQDVCITEMGP